MASILPIDEYSLGADTQINYQDPGPIATGQAPPMAESPLPLGPMGGGGAPPASRQLRELMATPLPQAEVPLNWADKMMSWHPVNQASRAQRQSDAQAGIVKERQRQVGDLKTAWEIEQKQFTAQKEQIAMVSEFVLKHPGATQVERVRAGQAAKKMGVELGLSDATHPIIDAIVRQPSVAQAAAHLMPFIEDVGAFNDALAASGGIAKSGGDVASASYKMASMTVKRRLFERLGEISLAYKDQGKPVDPEDALAQLKRSGDQGPFMHDVFVGNAPPELALNPEERAYTQEVLGFPDLAGLAKAAQTGREEAAKKRALQAPDIVAKEEEREATLAMIKKKVEVMFEKPQFRDTVYEELTKQGVTNPREATPGQVGKAISAVEDRLNERAYTTGYATGRGQAEGRLGVPEKASPGERERLVQDVNALSLIGDVRLRFKSGFVGPVRGRLGGPGEKVGVISQEESEFRTSVNIMRNKIIQEIGQSQVPEAEERRITSQIPTVELPGPAFEARLKVTEENMRRLAEQRRQQLKATGVETKGLPKLPSGGTPEQDAKNKAAEELYRRQKGGRP